MAREPTVKEKERMAAGPRYDPGKPTKRWGDGGAEPAPPQKPPPPTLEPVIPQPYIEPKDAKVVSTDAKGNPTVLETPDGKKHYTPFQNTMWGELGFKTEEEYKKSQRTGEPSQYVGISKGVDTPIRVSRAQMIEAGKLKGEAQFKAYRDIGVIPYGSKFMPGPGGYQGKDWGYLHPDTLKQIKGRLIARQAASQIELGLAWRVVPGEEVPGVLPPGSPVNRFAEAGVLNLNDAVGAGFVKASDYKGWHVTQAEIDKIVGRNDALQVLADKGYKGYGDSYRVVDALVSDDPKVLTALETVFSERDLNAAQKWIDRHWGAHGRFIPGQDKPIPLTKEVQQALRKVTPWKEEKGGTLLNYLQKYRKQIPVPPSPLAALAAPVAVTPIPWDDLLFYSAIAGGAAFGLWKLSKEMEKTTTQFRSTFERSPIPEDLVFISSEGMAMGIKDMDPEKKRIPGVSIVPIDPKIPALFPRDFRQRLPGVSIVKVDPKLPPITTKAVEPALYLPTPMISREELTGIQAGLLKAVAAVAVAEEALKKALPSTKTIPINWDKILEDAQKAKTKEDIKKAFGPATVWLPKLAPDIAGHFTRNYQEYLRKRAILDSARGQYIASLNPTPIKGKSSNEAIGILASYIFAKTAGLPKPKEWEQITPYLRRVLGKDLNKIAKAATAVSIRTLIKAINKGRTATQSATQAVVATQAAIQSQVNNLTKNLTLTQTQAQALTQAVAITATHIAVASAMATGVMTRPMAATATAALTATAAPITTTVLGKIPSRGASDKEKRQTIRAAKGAIAWRHGELHGKDVFHVGIYPYRSEEHYFTVIGKKPEGATIIKGPGSARQTIKLLYGKAPPKTIRGDIGFFDFAIKPIGPRKVSIDFIPDPKMQTTGDITIGRRTPPISERRTGLGRGKAPRITPTTPRLRR